MLCTLVIIAPVDVFILELNFFYLDCLRIEIYRDSEKMVRWESEYLEKGSVILTRRRQLYYSPGS